MTKKLTKVQQETLNKMEIGKDYSSYELRVSLYTMESLSKKNLIICSKNGLGSMFSPRTTIKWRKLK